MNYDILFLVLIFVLGWVIGEIMMIQKIRNITKGLGINLDQEVTDARVEKFMKDHKIFTLETEKVDDTLLLYDTETKTFICQGATLEELAVKINEEKNIEYAAVHHIDKVFVFIKGVVAEKVEIA